METKTSVIEALLEGHDVQNLIAMKPGGTESANKILVLDGALWDVDKCLAKLYYVLKVTRLVRPKVIVMNEAAAIWGTLLAVGYGAEDLKKLRDEGTFDPLKLIMEKQVLGKTHTRTNGAEHKGFRMRDALDELLKAKLKRESSPTFSDVKGARIYIQVLDSIGAEPVMLSADTFPTMKVADAVLASCAVQPYIGRVEFIEENFDEKGKTVKTVHNFYSASPKVTLPYDFAAAIATKEFHAPTAIYTYFLGVAPFSTENKVSMPHYLLSDSEKSQAKKEKSAESKDAYRLLSLTRAPMHVDKVCVPHLYRY